MLTALAEFPGTVDYIIETYDEVRAENKLADLFIGYLDPTEHVPQAPQVDLSKKDETKDDDSEEEEVDRGPDPEEAMRRFTALKRAYNKSQKTLSANSRAAKASRKDLDKLGQAFCSFKLVPRHYDSIVLMARDAISRVRQQERTIMQLAVREARMPRKQFV